MHVMSFIIPGFTSTLYTGVYHHLTAVFCELSEQKKQGTRNKENLGQALYICEQTHGINSVCLAVQLTAGCPKENQKMKSVLILFLVIVVCAYGEETAIVVDLSAVLKPITDKLVAQGKMLEQLRQENADMKRELSAEVEHLKNTIVKPQVAFTAALGKKESTGSSQKSLIFPKVLTNIGQAYSSSTGVFEAPLKGAYYFRFTVTDELDSHWMGIQMYKNEEKILWLSEYDGDGKRTYVSSGVTLELKTGDKVNLRLPPGGHALFDDFNNHCIFSGFLLFLL